MWNFLAESWCVAILRQTPVFTTCPRSGPNGSPAEDRTSMTSRQQRLHYISISISIEAIVVAIYFIRDAFGGVMRYYSSTYHVEALWFLPDIIATLCIGIFIYRCIIQHRSIVALLVLLQILLSLFLGYLFLGTFN